MNALRVIFVHGVSPEFIDWDYSAECHDLLCKELVRLGVIPRHATPEEISHIITFERVNYSDVGVHEEARVLASYARQHEHLFNLSYLLTEASGLEQVRKRFVNTVGDVLVYKSDYWRDQIRNLLVRKLDPYAGTGDAVSIVAHSLGSVIAFDVLYYGLRHNTGWISRDFKPRNLFTMGSPIALFSMDLERQSGAPKARYAHDAKGLDLVHPDGVWYNFLDAQDLLAYPLEVLFQGKFRVTDVVVQTGTTPVKAHTGYWDNDKLVEMVAERLALDYERINRVAEPQPDLLVR